MLSLGLGDEIHFTVQLRVKHLVVSISVRGWEMNPSQLSVFPSLNVHAVDKSVHAAEKEKEREIRV